MKLDKIRVVLIATSVLAALVFAKIASGPRTAASRRAGMIASTPTPTSPDLPASKPHALAIDEMNDLIKRDPVGAFAKLREMDREARAHPPAIEEPPEIAKLNPADKQRLTELIAKLKDGFRKLEKSAAAVTFDGDVKGMRTRAVRLTAPENERLAAYYAAATAAMQDAPKDSPLETALRVQADKMFAEFGSSAVVVLNVDKHGEKSISAILPMERSTVTPDRPDEDGNFPAQGRTQFLMGAFERYGYLFEP